MLGKFFQPATEIYTCGDLELAEIYTCGINAAQRSLEIWDLKDLHLSFCAKREQVARLPLYSIKNDNIHYAFTFPLHLLLSCGITSNVVSKNWEGNGRDS